jgi:hypothetical protein
LFFFVPTTRSTNADGMGADRKTRVKEFGAATGYVTVRSTTAVRTSIPSTPVTVTV